MKYTLSHKLLGAAMRATDTSQTALAEAAGITQVSVHDMLKKDRDSSIDILLAIADHMGVSPTALVNKTEGDPSTIPLSAAFELSDRLDIPLHKIAKFD